MNLKELMERRAKLLAQVDGADEKRFAEIKAEIAKIDYQINECKKQEEADAAQRAKEQREADERAARLPSNKGKAVLFDGTIDGGATPAQTRSNEQVEAVEKRANSLKAGEKTVIEHRTVVSTSTAMSTLASSEINPAFEQVGTLDGLVNEVHLEGAGAESYKKPFAIAIGEGGITAEGADYTEADPTFGYASINKVKVTAYAEVTEEVEKLPPAPYVAQIDGAVVGALRKKIIDQILFGSGTDELVGIVNAPTDIIDSDQKKTIATIDENTLDEIIFDYGGDENVEGDATLVLNKLTLKAFAAVKGDDKRRAYDIAVKGNSGTINGIPFVCTSKLPAYDTATTNPYIIYGNLKGYELAYFSDIEVLKSADYKFKQGVTAFKASVFVGGSPAMYNGFLTVVKS